MNFDSLTAKNMTGVFTHPPKIMRFRNLTANLTASSFGMIHDIEHLVITLETTIRGLLHRLEMM